MRNFYLDAQVDGRKNHLHGGPAAKSGGMSIDVYQNHDAESELAVKVLCQATESGTLLVQVYDPHGNLLFARTSQRPPE